MIWLVVALLGSQFASPVPSASKQPGDNCRVFMAYSFEGGREIEFCISSADARRLPIWDPEREDPPLAVSRAVEIGRAHTKGMRPEWERVAIVRVEIAPLHVGADEPPFTWYYNLTIASSPYPESWHTNNFHLVVLMDGTVVEGRPAKRDR
jgi:hypothetical protein